MKNQWMKTWSLCCALLFAACYAPSALAAKLVDGIKTQRVMLSGTGNDDTVEWDFYCTKGRNSGKWGKIAVPSNWELQGYGNYSYGKDEVKSDEEGLYRTTFVADKAWRKDRVRIVFEGSMTDTEVKLNGHKLGITHQGSFYRFKRDLNKYLKYGKENLLEVKVSKTSSNETVNEAERQCDFWILGGIYRPVYLEITPKTHIETSAFDAKHDGRMQADIYINKAIKQAEAVVELRDADQKLVGTCTSGVVKAKGNKLHVAKAFESIKAWSPEYPNLYTATIILKEKGKEVHRITERIGFRTIEMRKQDGFYLNNEKVMFKGVNRHCFWPTSGRTTSKKLSIQDALLIKEMNMNAVRMSHYSPDDHFLEACDSLGLMVIDELTAWHPPAYDTKVGSILVKEMLEDDVNHASIVLWANGNEGGFNYAFPPMFEAFDLQKREVLHPWSWSWNRKSSNLHYISYNEGVGSMFSSKDVFFPTECLHGAYDGGHGAGLEDYWDLMKKTPNSAGLFLWVFSDEGIVRRDRNDSIDTNYDMAPDGILGPYREKEASFYTIQNIWSPVQIQNFNITPAWNQRCVIENYYQFTNLDKCTIEYSLDKVTSLTGEMQSIGSGRINLPAVDPQGRKRIELGIPDTWKQADVLTLKVYDYNKKPISTWTYEINTPAEYAAKALNIKQNGAPAWTIGFQASPAASPLKDAPAGLQASTEGDNLVWKTERLKISISKKDGMLKEVVADGEVIPLKNGPFLVHPVEGGASEVYISPKADTIRVDVMEMKKKKKRLFTFAWTMNKEGVLVLDYDYALPGLADLSGVSFDYPEKEVEGADLFARGPYRVYKNRLRGPNLGIWHKEYNNTITGESWIYPEFKGYYSNFYAARFITKKPFEIYSGTNNMYLHLFTPDTPHVKYKVRTENINIAYPEKNISFMNAIPAKGTKFRHPSELGPSAAKNYARNRPNAGSVENRLYFKF